MYCPDCGASLDPHDQFCGSCGSKAKDTNLAGHQEHLITRNIPHSEPVEISSFQLEKVGEITVLMIEGEVIASDRSVHTTVHGSQGHVSRTVHEKHDVAIQLKDGKEVYLRANKHLQIHPGTRIQLFYTVRDKSKDMLEKRSPSYIYNANTEVAVLFSPPAFLGKQPYFWIVLIIVATVSIPLTTIVGFFAIIFFAWKWNSSKNRWKEFEGKMVALITRNKGYSVVAR